MGRRACRLSSPIPVSSSVKLGIFVYWKFNLLCRIHLRRRLWGK